MKIIVVQENLRNALAICSRAVANSSTLPILGNILLQTKNGMLQMSSTNLEIGIAELVRCKVETEGAVCIPARLLNDVVTNLPSEPVTISAEGGEVKLAAGKFRTTLKTVPVDDFPKVVDTLPAEAASLPAAAISRAIEGVLFAVSTNETQVELCGVSLAVKSDELVIAATDRYRLAECVVPLVGDRTLPLTRVIFPTRAMAEVVRSLHALGGGDVVLGVQENQAVFGIGNTIISTRLIDGQFPEYDAIIPKDFSVTVDASRQECVAALKAVSVFSKGAAGVSVSYDEAGQQLLFSARSQEAGEGVVEVGAAVVGGSDTALFNPRYLLDMMQFLTSQNVRVKLNSPTSAVVFEGLEDPHYRYLVMPIKT